MAADELLQHGERIRQWYDAEQLGCRQVAAQQRRAYQLPAPVQGAEEQQHQADLRRAAQEQVAPAPQLAAEGGRAAYRAAPGCVENPAHGLVRNGRSWLDPLIERIHAGRGLGRRSFDRHGVDSRPGGLCRDELLGDRGIRWSSPGGSGSPILPCTSLCGRMRMAASVGRAGLLAHAATGAGLRVDDGDEQRVLAGLPADGSGC
jgi:hypothetical protein